MALSTLKLAGLVWSIPGCLVPHPPME